MVVPWGGLSCCLSAAALYLLGRSSGRDADVLKSVTRVNQLKDLAHLLDTAAKVLPLVVTVSGRVGSDTPITCQYSGLRGVIVEETAEQHFLKHNDAGSWIQDSALMLSMCKEVPWYLDDGTGRAFIVGVRGASGLVLTVGSEVFEESGRSLVRGTLDYIQGLKMLGVKRIERVLPTGTALTVVGEAVKDDVGTIRIQQPLKGPFYASHKTVDQLIANLGKWARWYRYASVGFTIFGLYLLTKHAVQYILERRRHWEMRKRVLDAAAKRSGEHNTGPDGNIEEGSDFMRKDKLTPDLCVALVKKDPVRRQVLSVKGCLAGSSAEHLLEQGDMILAINKEPVTCFRDVENACESLDQCNDTDGRLNLTIFRQGCEMDLFVGTDVRDGNGTTRVINWCGCIIQDPHPAVRALGFLPEEGHGVYVARWCHGSPVHRYGLYALQWIVEINGKPTPDLDAFVNVTKEIEDREFVRVRTIHLNGKPRVLTLKQDLHYWPTWELRFDPVSAIWRRNTIKALDGNIA